MFQFYNQRAVLEKGAEDFNRIFTGFNLDTVFQPKQAELNETDTEGTITVFVPGHDSSTLEIGVTEGSITLNSIAEKLSAQAQEIFRVWKFSSNRYDQSTITAECKNGILTITLPRKKSTEKTTTKIKIG